MSHGNSPYSPKWLMYISTTIDWTNLVLGTDSANPQMLLFSATVPYWVREVADRYMSHDKVVVDLIGRQSLKTAVTVEHKAICCPYAERPSTIADVIQVRQGKLTISYIKKEFSLVKITRYNIVHTCTQCMLYDI